MFFNIYSSVSITTAIPLDNYNSPVRRIITKSHLFSYSQSDIMIKTIEKKWDN